MAHLPQITATALAAIVAAQLSASVPLQGVTVSVSVLDAANRPVTDLTTEEFEVFVDASAVPVTSVSRRGPLSLAVVIDTSRSTGWGRTGSIRAPHEEVLVVLSSLRDDDMVRFASFGPRVRFAGPWRPRSCWKTGNPTAVPPVKVARASSVIHGRTATAFASPCGMRISK